MEVWTMFVKDAFQRAFSFTKFLCVMHATCNYVVTPTILQGPSMLPTIQITGDYALAQPISTMRGKVGRGDIVTARSPENPRKTILKRVMGLEGDQVTYNVDPTNSDSFKTIVVPEGHVWIEGDNEHDTHDSRHFGAIPYGLLEGRIFWRFWPPGRIGPLGKKAE